MSSVPPRYAAPVGSNWDQPLSDGDRFVDRPELLAIMLTEQRFECPCPVDAADFLIDAVGTQQVARPSVRAHDAQRGAARGEFGV